ncbi:MAG: hypothetical protein JXR37_25080 [Kiritimatiellae bacterium]|nr:hypothetical protein [Kiritimatiellia bacterium]
MRERRTPGRPPPSSPIPSAFRVWAVPGLAVFLLVLAFLIDGGRIRVPKTTDLWGGVHLVYQLNEADAAAKGIRTDAERRTALERMQEGFYLRLREFDQTELKVRVVGNNRILVEVPGTKAIEEVKSKLGDCAVLSFRLVRGTPISAADAAERKEPPGKGWFFDPKRQEYWPLGRALLGAEQIDHRKTTVDQGGMGADFFVRLALRPAYESAFADLTTRYHEKILAICLDTEIVCLPRISAKGIRQPIITGDFSAKEATQLAAILRAGPLPASLDLRSQYTVDPTLGTRARQRGLYALIIGGAAVALLIVLAYADHLAMVVSFFVCFAVDAVVILLCARFGWPALNMVSLAALVVLVGISADNLILVFEEYRNRTEGADGKSGQATILSDRVKSLGATFKGEDRIVVLANLTTVLTLLPILMIEGSIRDLIIMMSLGIGLALLVNFFYGHSLVTFRPFALPLERKRLAGRPLLSCSWDIFRFRRPVAWAYMALVAASVAAVATRGFNVGLDFRAGMQILLVADRDLGTGELAACAQDYFGTRAEITRKRDAALAQDEFHYLVRVPTGETLREAAPDGDAAGTAAHAPTAEGFVKRVGERTGAAVRADSIDMLSASLALLNRRIVWISAVFALVVLAGVVAYAYRPSYAIPVVAALLFDCVIVLGAVSLFQVPLSIPLLAAILTIAGYSINDSLVLCGHVKKGVGDDLKQRLSPDDFSAILKPLASRIFLTSLTTLSPALALWVLGVGLVRDFGLVIAVGVVVGTVSSVSLVACGIARVQVERTS